MPEKIVQLNEEVIKGKIKALVRGSVEETLNELLEAEAEKLTQAARYERSDERQGYRSGHYSRNLTTTSGDVTAQESKKAAREKAKAVVEQLHSMKLKEAAKKVEDGIEETLTYADFLSSTGPASGPTTLLSGSTGKSAAEPGWWAPSRMATPPSCWSVPACAMWPAPSGAIKIT